ncbi:PH domain-containing protein [Solimonas sp. SE-A11]|uniref:PH domain-containing protein n=1 Tax=Solimonas sp. SE-A11 TaxID=3054954 RepID=UPI00259CE14E|nr:PH domain-containing protein [Solimonas sp. SE-A11]MDM4772962.1 PH domain-containing protein [Solimonas sp. SE-A11]
MSVFEVWAAGRPLSGFTDDMLQSNVRALFPKGSQEQIARFTSGARFIVTRVPDEETAKRVVEALTKAGVPAEYRHPAPPPSQALAGVELVDEPPPANHQSPPPIRSRTQTHGPNAPKQPQPSDQDAHRPSVPPERVGSYVKRVLMPDERVEYVARVSLWPYALVIFFGVFLTFAWGVGLLILLGVYITYISTELAVTNKRVIAKFGFIRRNTVEMKIGRVESVQVNQGIFGRVFNYGSIVLAGAGTPQAPIPNVSDPLEFRRAFNDSQESAANAR